MEIVYTVYKHLFPNNKVYIGITKQDPKIRYGKNGYQYHTNPRMWADIQKYGWNNIKHEILYTNIPLSEISALEQKLINKYQANNPKYGYNRNKGGLFGASTYFDENKIIKLFTSGLSEGEIAAEIGCCTRTVGEILHKNGISKEKILAHSQKIKRNKTSVVEHHKEKIFDLFFNQHKSILEIARVLNMDRQCIDKLFAREGITHETIKANTLAIPLNEIENIKSLLLQGKTLKEIGMQYHCGDAAVHHFIEHSLPEYKELIHKNGVNARAKAYYKPVHQYDLDGKYLQTFLCIGDAAESLGKRRSDSHISQACKGQRNSAYGYKWAFANKSNNEV